ncbi:Nn.00g010540.m01.CDS01 [Neocucurbitaria sp. VM-36]
MVYRGRPSTGCKKCRERKIKCDERAEGCVKCAERGYTCPGYDRTGDVFFLDETENVQERAKKSKAKAIAARDARHARNPSAAFLRVQAHEGPTRQLMSSLIDQGVTFFMSNYCMGVDQPPITSKAYHKYLSTDGFHPLVATTMTALGIAGVANLYVDPTLKREATRWYLNAIKMANAAISSPREVKADTTLVAVNLLGMFEATFNDRSLSGWSNHVDGAASLVKMRGMEQFATPAGQRMYLHTVGLLTMNCMGKGIALPDYVREMNHEVMNHVDIKDPRNAFFFLHIKTIDLRAQILNQHALDVADVIHSALELDDIAISVFRDAGPDWQYEEVPCDAQMGIYGDFYHVYPTAAAAQTWNWVRYNRIYFHDIIRNSILAGFATSPPTLAGPEYYKQLAESTRILHAIQSDILASMPQFMGTVSMFVPDSSTIASSKPLTPPLLSPPVTSSPIHTSSSPSTPGRHKSLHQNFRADSGPVFRDLVGNGAITDRIPIVRISGGYSTVWALYVAGSMPTASPLSQDFVYTCLKRIECEFGINQARVLGDALKFKRQLDSSGATAFGICPQYLPPDGGPYVPYQGTDSKVGFMGPELLMNADFQAGFPSVGRMQSVH